MYYSLTEVPHCLGTPYDFFAKTKKVLMLQNIIEDYTDEVPYPNDAFYIQDDSAFIHALKDLPSTIGGICLKMLDQIVSNNNFVISTDSYDKDSFKTLERLRRGLSQKFIVNGPATRNPQDLKVFLQNEENNEQLFYLVLRVWNGNEAASRLATYQSAILIVKGNAHKLVVSNGEVEVSEIPELSFCTSIMRSVLQTLTFFSFSSIMHTPSSSPYIWTLVWASTDRWLMCLQWPNH